MRNAIFAMVSWGPALFYIFIIDPDIDVKSLPVKFSDDLKVCEVPNNGGK